MKSQEDIDKLAVANKAIFEVEQKWRKDGLDYAADTLFEARKNINWSYGRFKYGYQD